MAHQHTVRMMSRTLGHTAGGAVRAANLRWRSTCLRMCALSRRMCAFNSRRSMTGLFAPVALPRGSFLSTAPSLLSSNSPSSGAERSENTSAMPAAMSLMAVKFKSPAVAGSWADL